jgi:hypothetical protein
VSPWWRSQRITRSRLTEYFVQHDGDDPIINIVTARRLTGLSDRQVRELAKNFTSGVERGPGSRRTCDLFFHRHEIEHLVDPYLSDLHEMDRQNELARQQPEVLAVTPDMVAEPDGPVDEHPRSG